MFKDKIEEKKQKEKTNTERNIVYLSFYRNIIRQMIINVKYELLSLLVAKGLCLRIFQPFQPVERNCTQKATISKISSVLKTATEISTYVC